MDAGDFESIQNTLAITFSYWPISFFICTFFGNSLFQQLLWLWIFKLCSQLFRDYKTYQDCYDTSVWFVHWPIFSNKLFCAKLVVLTLLYDNDHHFYAHFGSSITINHIVDIIYYFLHSPPLTICKYCKTFVFGFGIKPAAFT